MPKQIANVWIPDGDTLMEKELAASPRFAGAGTHQLRKLQAAMKWITNFRHAVDVGAHCGLSRVLAQMFGRLKRPSRSKSLGSAVALVCSSVSARIFITRS